MSESREPERRITVRPSTGLATRTRPRGMWGQITTTLLRPGLFYKTLLPTGETRQWLWAAILILVLVGVANVRYSALRAASAPAESTVPDMGMGMDPMMGGDFGGMGMDPMMGGDFGGVGPGMPDPSGAGGGGTGATSTLTSDLTTALLAASNIVLGWVVLTAMLVVVPMLRGRPPRVGQNFQIAIWSSLPLAAMAVLQLVYYASGGQVGEPGVQGLLKDIPAYAEQPSMVQALLVSFTSRLTVFWLWSLLLVYFGARFALGGWRIVALLIVIAWAGVQIVAPVLTEAITVPVGEELPVDGGLGGGDFGDFGPDMGGDFGPDMGGDDFPMDDGPDNLTGEETGEMAGPDADADNAAGPDAADLPAASPDDGDPDAEAEPEGVETTPARED